METHLALLRGINVGGHKRVPMAALRELCAALGFADVRTHVQSGNLVFRATRPAAALSAALERAIADRFGHAGVEVMVTTRREWSAFVEGNPFEREAEASPERVLLGVAKSPVPARAAADLEALGTAGERARAKGRAFYLHFPEGVGRSRVWTALTRRDDLAVTTRNWRTVLALQELARAVADGAAAP